MQAITNDPPPPDGQPLDPAWAMGTTYSHSISELGWFTTVFGIGVHLNDINTKSMAITVNPEDDQTPITVDVQFETGGPEEVTGSYDMDIVNLEIHAAADAALPSGDARRSTCSAGWTT